MARLAAHRVAGSILDVVPARPPAFQLGYRPWLDGLRGCAILMVLALHCGLLGGGSLGVDVFFVLSGFLITTLLVEERQRHGVISLRRFYLRRALRLVPGLLTALALYALSSWLLAAPAERAACWWEIAVAGLYVANWPNLHGVPMHGLAHTWSLSVEEQFYLLWPPLLVLLLSWRLTPRRLLMLVGAGIVACVVLRIALYHLDRVLGMDRGLISLRLYMGLDTRADSLLVGCGVGLLAARGWLPRSRRAIQLCGRLALLSLAVLAYLACFSSEMQAMYFHGLLTAVALMVAVILVRLLVAPSRATAWLEFAPLVGIGRISYGLYLYHVVVITGVEAGCPSWGRPAQVALIVVLSFALALVSYFGVERPCLRLKDRLRPTAAPAERADLAPRRAA